MVQFYPRLASFRRRFKLFFVVVLSWYALSPIAPKAQQLSAPQPGQTPAEVEPAEKEEEDPDVPAFALGMIDKEEYMELREAYTARLMGMPYDVQNNPRVRAIRQMEAEMGPQSVDKSAQVAATLNSFTWSPIGPFPIPNGQTSGTTTAVSGRTIAIAVHPTNANIVYAGTAQGGLWRSMNGGTTWVPIMDDALSLAVNAIAFHPTDPTTLFVGTGESGGSADSFFGVGLYRIKKADTIAQLEGPFGAAQLAGRSISKIVVDPTNANMLWVSTGTGVGGLGGVAAATVPARGVYRSSNALAATPTFTKLTVPTGDTNARVMDMVLEPGNPDVLIAAVNDPVAAPAEAGLWRSANARAATPVFTQVLAVAGRTELSAVKIAATVTFAAATSESNGSIRTSTDGINWTTVLSSSNGYCGGQCFYDMAIAISPTNALNILVGGSAAATVSAPNQAILKRTTNGSTFAAAQTGLHADTHAITYAPSNSSVVYTGNDGGIYRSADGGATWTSRNTAQFSATQFQSIATHPSDQNFTIGGTQDNGTNFYQPGGTWTRADFGDGGFALIDQNAANTTNVTMYHTYFNQAFGLIGFARVFSTACATEGNWAFFGRNFVNSNPICGGQVEGTNNGIANDDAVLFYAPMALGPGSPNTLYFGTNRLYRSTDSGTTMTPVSQTRSGIAVSAIAIAPTTDNVRVIGYRDGTAWFTASGNTTLTQATFTGASLGASPYVGRIAIDPNDAQTAYVGFSNYGKAANQSVWKTTNLSGGTFTASGSGIPDVPVNALVVDPTNSNVVYAGTDIGVYKTTNGGTSWTAFSNGLPRVAIFGMSIQPTSRILRVATHGRGMWEIALTASPLNDLIFKDGVDSGNFSAWSATSLDGGDFAVNSSSPLDGPWDIKAIVNDTNPLFVQDETPNAEGEYRGRFFFYPNTFDPGEAKSHFRTRLFFAQGGSPVRRLMAIILRRQGGANAYSLRGCARLDNNINACTSFYNITNAAHEIQWRWKKATSAGANNGSFELWVDGVSQEVLPNLDNDVRGIDTGRLGILSTKGGSSGISFFDRFDSRRYTYIIP